MAGKIPSGVKRAAIFLLFIPTAVVVSALFGALHDQISYSVSPEYFTKFKFFQFGLLSQTVPERIRAGEVGVMASWWMGIPLGVLCGLGGFVQRTPALMLRALMLSLVVAVGFTLLAAFVGLAYGWMETQVIHPESYRSWFIPPNITHLRRFLCAGYMHNAAYAGGALSIVVVWIFNVVFRRLV